MGSFALAAASPASSRRLTRGSPVSAAAGPATSNEVMTASRLLAAGVGAAMIMPVTLDVSSSALPAERPGVASALNVVTREFGAPRSVSPCSGRC